MGTPNKLSQQVDEIGGQVTPVVIVDPTTPTQQAGVNASGQLTLVIANGNPNGQATMVNSSPVVLPSDQFGAEGDASASSDSATASYMSLFKRLLSKFPSALNFDANNNIKVNLRDGSNNPVVIDTVLGGLTVEQFIEQQILAGHGYRVTTGQIATNAANAWLAVQGVTNNLSVNVLLYNIMVSCNASTSDVRLYQNEGAITTDAGLTVDIHGTIKNQKVGGSASALATLNASPGNTTQASPSNAGTQVSGLAVVGNSTLNILSNRSLLWLPKSAQNTFWVGAIEGTSGNKVSITLEWIEF